METLDEYRKRTNYDQDTFKESSKAIRERQMDQYQRSYTVFTAITDLAEITEVEASASKGANIALIKNYKEWAEGLAEGENTIVELMGEGMPCHGRKAGSVYSALTQVIKNNEDFKESVRVIKKGEDRVYLRLL